MERVTLYQQYRLIERNENEISVVWKGAHLLLFFLAFVFGSLCTFCMHILMYMFDQNCVLYPKIVNHPSVRHIVYEYFSISDSEQANDVKGSTVPIDFLNTHWVENSVCYLPTYVPLVSGLFGIVWTTMFLMCSSGTSNPTGLQRQWRALPAMFLFSVAMGGLCIYATSITNCGLQDLCNKLAEVTGSSSCTYTVNVVTLVYERRIRGVYQAIALTIATAWLHTACWLLSALVTMVRVLLAVDFQLVCVKAELIGNVDRMLEKYERQIQFIAPESTVTDTSSKTIMSDSETVFEINNETEKATIDLQAEDTHEKYFAARNAIFISQTQEQPSESSLVPEERFKLARSTALDVVPHEHKFIVRMLYDLLEIIDLRKKYDIDTSSEVFDTSSKVTRQRGQEDITAGTTTPREALNPEEAKKLATEVRLGIRAVSTRHVNPCSRCKASDTMRKTESSRYLVPKIKEAIDANFDQVKSEDVPGTDPSSPLKENKKKSNLRSKGIQVSGTHKVQIQDTAESDETVEDNPFTYKNKQPSDTNKESSRKNTDKQTQTTKEKQD